jgi:hypothetical protein
VRWNNPDYALVIAFVFVSGESPENPDFDKLADASQYADRAGTNTGKCSRVSFGHLTWWSMITAPAIEVSLGE